VTVAVARIARVPWWRRALAWWRWRWRSWRDVDGIEYRAVRAHLDAENARLMSRLTEGSKRRGPEPTTMPGPGERVKK
jgi:hypothetical protein